MTSEYEHCLLRLSDLEQQKLQLVVAALKVSEYTDDVDDFRRPYNKESRMERAMYELFDTIIGLAIASDAIPKATKDALLKGDISVNTIVPLLEDLFEILRRHKRLNPFSHRGEYGKLVMLLQDVQKSSIRRTLGITSSLLVPLRTVGATLTMLNCEALLNDGNLKPQFLRAEGAKKSAGLAALVDKYAGTEDDKRRALVERCLRSMDDVRQFQLGNIASLRYLRAMVRDFAEKDISDRQYNIAISAGRGGACFSHNHLTHCQYVEESLLLWENVQRSIFDMWEVAEADMLIDGGGAYDFANTGQGFHRMCRAPKSYTLMSSLVRATERTMGGWIGIKVIHLGDRDVPNPLVFIDKYTIIPRIVHPVMHTIVELERLFSEGGGAEEYVGLRELLRAKYHSFEELQTMILSDFFKHAFDGSGDDGGSCIDGRLTSAWNWCHQLDKKPYYDAFVLTGFNGFD